MVHVEYVNSGLGWGVKITVKGVNKLRNTFVGQNF